MKTKILTSLLIITGLAVTLTGCVSLNSFWSVDGNENDDNPAKESGLEVFTDARGLDYDSYVIFNQNDEDLINEVKMGDVLALDVDGLSGYEMIDGVYYPQMDVTIFDSYASKILEVENVLSPEYDDGLLKGMYVYPTSVLSIGEEIFMPGESYVWSSLLRDTIGGGELEFSVIFKVAE